MKRIEYIILIFALCSACILLASCDEVIKKITPIETGTKITQSATASETITETAPKVTYARIDTDNCVFENDIKRKAAEKADGAINHAIDILNKYLDSRSYNVLDFDPLSHPLAYEALDETKKAHYDRMYAGASSFSGYVIDENDFKERLNPFGDIVDALYAIYEDYPVTQLYYTDISTDGHTHVPRYFLPNDYAHEADDIEQVKHGVTFYNAVFDRILECVPEGLSNYGKCMYFTAVISELCTYDYGYETMLDPFQAYNALVGGKTVCAGYTEAFQLLCRASGVECGSVKGKAAPDDIISHIWNVVQTDLGPRYIDVTWTDNNIEKSGLDFYFEYFMMDSDDLEYEGYIPDSK